MFIKKIKIVNFKGFQGDFFFEPNKGLNILVGDNEVGKSTILEAINLALSGWINGRYISSELTQSQFNHEVVQEYLNSLNSDNPLSPPEILIELYFSFSEENDALKALFEGTKNSLGSMDCGVQFKISFDEKFSNEYECLIGTGEPLLSLPIEYYNFSWSSFARDDSVTPKTIPLKTSFIDSSKNSYRNGSDVYISRIIRNILTDEQLITIAQEHRKLNDNFIKSQGISSLNKDLRQKDISDKKVEISLNLSTKTAWKANLSTYLDDIPFSNIGKGEQSLVKTKLALSHKKSKEANILLLEEPENHLSFSRLNKLMKFLAERGADKQIFVSTHNSFVANKLGLKNLILLNSDNLNGGKHAVKIEDLSDATQNYFTVLPGYDTLRMILAKKSILVEGPSDELIVQKVYLIKHKRLPIEDGVDVISVGTSFLRFLELAKKTKSLVAVVTDNDRDYEKNIKHKYSKYVSESNIKIFADDRNELNTLEPQFLDANSSQLKKVRRILGLKKSNYPDLEALKKYMLNNKTTWALKVFNDGAGLNFPAYITEAVDWDNE